MAARYMGAHMPISKGLGSAVRNGKAIGCTAVQVFTSSPQQWRRKAISDEMVADFRAALEETGIPMEAIVSHDSYLVNLCALDPDKRAQSVRGLTEELEACARYGIPYAVSHVGAAMGQCDEDASGGAAESLKQVLGQTEGTLILMETTAGQGSCLNHRFESLADLLERCQGHPRLGVCLDTCHVFAAGYDLSTDEGYDAVWSEFERVIGLDRLKAIHANDSQKALGSRVDRHAHIGAGHIGARAFERLVNDPRFDRVPILLETPDAETHHEANLARLWAFQAA